MKTIRLLFILALVLNASDITRYTDAFDTDRYRACEKATAMAHQMKNLDEKSGCNCEKIDFDGWRCLVRYTLKNEANATN